MKPSASCSSAPATWPSATLPFRRHRDCRVVAGVDISEERVKAFCQKHGIPTLLHRSRRCVAWGEFDAVTNVTPDAVHYPTTMPIIETGKPIFCEKPLAPTYPLALEMTEAVEKRGIVNMVNLRYRGLPVMQMARALVEDGMIGEVRHIDACYLQSWLVGTHWGDWRTQDRWLWRLSGTHGSLGRSATSASTSSTSPPTSPTRNPSRCIAA